MRSAVKLSRMSLIIVDPILSQCLPSKQLFLFPAPIQDHHAIVAGKAGVDARQNHGDICQLVTNQEFDHRHHVVDCWPTLLHPLLGGGFVQFERTAQIEEIHPARLRQCFQVSYQPLSRSSSIVTKIPTTTTRILITIIPSAIRFITCLHFISVLHARKQVPINPLIGQANKQQKQASGR